MDEVHIHPDNGYAAVEQRLAAGIERIPGKKEVV
jgi:hypothetical protein